jgi:hypothetical protein
MKLRDEETGQLYECEYACDGINQDRYIKTGRMVVEDRSKWHPHYDLIVAYARGAEIQFWTDGKWEDVVGAPCWNLEIKYRIKPKKSASRMYKELLEMRKSIDSMLEEGE